MTTLATIIDQMQAAGITGLQEQDLIADDRLHRFKPNDSRTKTAWYVIHEFKTRSGTTIFTGAFGDWRGIKETIRHDGVLLSDDERDHLRRQAERKKRRAEKERKQKAAGAARRAEYFWQRLSDTGASAYLVRKQVRGYGVRYSPTGSLVIPMRDAGRALHGLQVIYAPGRERITLDGEKLEKDFWPYGVNPVGHFHLIGDIPLESASGRVQIVICEGYATGASIYEATAKPVCVAFNAGNLLPVAKALRVVYPDAELIIAGDDDYLTYKPVNNPGRIKAWEAAKKVDGHAIFPIFKNRNGEKWTDFNDLHRLEGLDAVAACFQRATEDWQHRISHNSQGNVKADINNILLILLNDERWQGVLRYDRFTYDVLKIKPPPFEHNARTGEWTESDTTWLQGWLSEYYQFTPKENDTIRAVLAVAELYGFHPVLDYLHGLTWDKTPRLDTWLSDYLGATKTEYTALAGRKFLIGAVARVHAELSRPVKMDNVLILEGPQGAGKSSVVGALASPWSAETHFDLGSKDGYLQMRGIWIYELSELDAFNKAEDTRAKMFFTASEDNYRPPYAKRTQRFPRQTIFIGTTNQEHYFKDATGNRRYWPVMCTEINIDALNSVRDQLWAEALHEYRAGEVWWVLQEERDLFKAEQDKRFRTDAWEELIDQFLNSEEQRLTDEFTTSDIMTKALLMQIPQIKPPELVRVGIIMSHLGWKKKRVRTKTGLRWVYERPQELKVATVPGQMPF